MSDTGEVVQSVIDKVLERVDQIASKLGLAATQIWAFTVKANVVNAKRDIATYAALMLVAVFLFGWSLHVAVNPLPHDMEVVRDYSEQACPPGYPAGYRCQSSTEKRQQKENLSDAGMALLISGIITAIIAIFVACVSVSGVIEGVSCLYTAEYDAYKDLVYDWKD